MLTLSRLEIDSVGHNVFQFHEFQFGCVYGNPAIRAAEDPFPLISTVLTDHGQHQQQLGCTPNPTALT